MTETTDDCKSERHFNRLLKICDILLFFYLLLSHLTAAMLQHHISDNKFPPGLTMRKLNTYSICMFAKPLSYGEVSTPASFVKR